MGAVQHAVGKSICGLSDVVRKWASQHLIGCKIYLLSILFFLLYLIKKTMLLCSFCWAFFIEILLQILHHLSPLPPHRWCRTFTFVKYDFSKTEPYFKTRKGKQLPKYCTKESDYESLYNADAKKKGKKEMDDKYFALLDTRKQSSPAYLKCCILDIQKN